MSYRDRVKQFLVVSGCPEEAHEGILQIAVASYDEGQRDMREMAAKGCWSLLEGLSARLMAEEIRAIKLESEL